MLGGTRSPMVIALGYVGGSGGESFLSIRPDVHGNLPALPDSATLLPEEARQVNAALLRNAEAALAQTNSYPNTDLIMWLPREANMAARLLAHLQNILTKS